MLEEPSIGPNIMLDEPELVSDDELDDEPPFIFNFIK
jgi:hypothetical protein